tara:strand:+ start:244 stop:537 length:294 start_codon:yes stop_codon:yes gene_type:complete
MMSVLYKEKILLILLQLTLLISAIVSGYHFLVQMGLIADKCIASINQFESPKEFLNYIQNHTSCSKISWSILGLPVSGLNFLLSLIFLCTGKIFCKI